jgi:hypothetical protein
MSTLRTEQNFFTKQELRDAVTANQTGSPPVKVSYEGSLSDGIYTVRGPHGNEPVNSWYTTVQVVNCYITKVLR